MAKATTRGRREPLSRARILDAAVALADADGLGRLSMRRLAQSLGVEAMSLYNHVRNKDDLLDGLVERVAEEFVAPESGNDWREEMRRRVRGGRDVLLRHPWATELIVSRVNVGPAMLRYVDATIGCLVRAGFSYPLADHAWNALDAYLYGFVQIELNFPFDPDEYADAAGEYLPRIPAERYPHLAAMSEEVMSGRHDGLHGIDFGLELLLAGLERTLAAQT